MWMVHEIFHAMSKSKEIWFYWVIHVATEAHGKVFNIVASLDSDVYEATNPVIEEPYMWVSICFRYHPIRYVAMKSVFSKDVSTGKCYFWNFTSSFVFFTQYYWIMFLMIWYIWSILIPYSLWIMLILRRLFFGRYSQRKCQIRVSICFRYYPIRYVAMKSVFSKDVSTGKCYFWNFTSSFVFYSQCYWIMFLMIWSIWSILIPYSLWIMLTLRRLFFGRYIQRKCQINALIFQGTSYSVFPWGCHLF